MNLLRRGKSDRSKKKYDTNQYQLQRWKFDRCFYSYKVLAEVQHYYSKYREKSGQFSVRKWGSKNKFPKNGHK